MILKTKGAVNAATFQFLRKSIKEIVAITETMLPNTIVTQTNGVFSKKVGNATPTKQPL